MTTQPSSGAVRAAEAIRAWYGDIPADGKLEDIIHRETGAEVAELVAALRDAYDFPYDTKCKANASTLLSRYPLAAKQKE